MTCSDPFLGVVAELRASLERRSYVQPTAIQQAVLAVDARETNLRISSRTGSGKTVALGIALSRDLLDHAGEGKPLALVVAPTRELAVQLRRELAWLYEDTSLAVAAVTGGANMGGERRALRAGPQLVVGTPGRLLDHLRQGTLDLSKIRHVVLDEADQMLDLGFRDELEAIVEALPDTRRSHLVSATFPPEVRRFADHLQGADVTMLQGKDPGEAHEDIEHCAYLLSPHERYDALVNELLMTHGRRCLVFVRRRVDAAEVAARLSDDGIGAQALSGDLAQAQRHRCLEAFRTGQAQVVVATDVAARGIDVADIQLVVHYDPPSDPANYIHRSGRTGRAGRKGQSLLFVPQRSERRARQLLAAAKVKARFSPPPPVERVQSTIRDEARHRLRSRLDAAPTIEPHHLHEAEALLAEHDPKALVAQLLAVASPEPPVEPRVLRSATRPAPSARKPARRAPEGGTEDGFVPFYVSWGGAKGATTKRVLALMCRRGDIPGRDVGRINVGPHATIVEVARPVAAQVREKAAAPDPRDPKIRIEPFRKREGAALPPTRREGRAKPRLEPTRRPTKKASRSKRGPLAQSR